MAHNHALTLMQRVRDANVMRSSDVDACVNMPLAKVPAALYALREYMTPLGTPFFEANFGPQINFLSGNLDGGQPPGYSTTLIQSNSVPTPFLLRAVGVYITVEPYAFGMTGMAYPTPASPTTAPVFGGVVTPATPDNGQRPATLEWGAGTWRAAWAALQAYRVRMILLGKFELFDELAADIGFIDADSTWDGFSSHLTPAMQRIFEANQQARLIQKPQIFLPQNAAGAGELVTGVAPPLVPTSYGSPAMCGVWGGFYPVKSMLLIPGMPIQLVWERDTENKFYNRFQQEMTDQGETTPDINITNLVTGGGAYSSVIPFKGGLIRIGVLLKGFELTPMACMAWYTNYAAAIGGLYNAAQSSQMLAGLAHQAGLSNLPKLEKKTKYMEDFLGALPKQLIGDQDQVSKRALEQGFSELAGTLEPPDDHEPGFHTDGRRDPRDRTDRASSRLLVEGHAVQVPAVLLDHQQVHVGRRRPAGARRPRLADRGRLLRAGHVLPDSASELRGRLNLESTERRQQRAEPQHQRAVQGPRWLRLPLRDQRALHADRDDRPSDVGRAGRERGVAARMDPHLEPAGEHQLHREARARSRRDPDDRQRDPQRPPPRMPGVERRHDRSGVLAPRRQVRD